MIHLLSGRETVQSLIVSSPARAVPIMLCVVQRRSASPSLCQASFAYWFGACESEDPSNGGAQPARVHLGRGYIRRDSPWPRAV